MESKEIDSQLSIVNDSTSHLSPVHTTELHGSRIPLINCDFGAVRMDEEMESVKETDQVQLTEQVVDMDRVEDPGPSLDVETGSGTVKETEPCLVEETGSDPVDKTRSVINGDPVTEPGLFNKNTTLETGEPFEVTEPVKETELVVNETVANGVLPTIEKDSSESVVSSSDILPVTVDSEMVETVVESDLSTPTEEANTGNPDSSCTEEIAMDVEDCSTVEDVISSSSMPQPSTSSFDGYPRQVLDMTCDDSDADEDSQIRDMKGDRPGTPLSIDASLDKFKASLDSLRSGHRQSRKRKRSGHNIEGNWLKPFDLGWKRELVYRKTDTPANRQGDVYYYTPTGKKLRSMPEIIGFLSTSKSSLSACCFTFAKQPIYEEPLETVREAKQHGRQTESPSVSSSKPKIKPKKSFKTEVAACKLESSADVNDTDPIAKRRKMRQSAERFNSSLSMNREKALAPAPPPPVPPTMEGVRKNGQTSRVRTVISIIVPRAITMGVGKQLKCGMSCPGRIDEPSIQCLRCLCRFHPECVGRPQPNGFYCTKCKKHWQKCKKHLLQEAKSASDAPTASTSTEGTSNQFVQLLNPPNLLLFGGSNPRANTRQGPSSMPQLKDYSSVRRNTHSPPASVVLHPSSASNVVSHIQQSTLVVYNGNSASTQATTEACHRHQEASVNGTQSDSSVHQFVGSHSQLDPSEPPEANKILNFFIPLEINVLSSLNFNINLIVSVDNRKLVIHPGYFRQVDGGLILSIQESMLPKGTTTLSLNPLGVQTPQIRANGKPIVIAPGEVIVIEPNEFHLGPNRSNSANSNGVYQSQSTDQSNQTNVDRLQSVEIDEAEVDMPTPSCEPDISEDGNAFLPSDSLTNNEANIIVISPLDNNSDVGMDVSNADNSGIVGTSHVDSSGILSLKDGNNPSGSTLIPNGNDSVVDISDNSVANTTETLKDASCNDGTRASSFDHRTAEPDPETDFHDEIESSTEAELRHFNNNIGKDELQKSAYDGSRSSFAPIYDQEVDLSMEIEIEDVRGNVSLGADSIDATDSARPVTEAGTSSALVDSREDSERRISNVDFDRSVTSIQSLEATESVAATPISPSRTPSKYFAQARSAVQSASDLLNVFVKVLSFLGPADVMRAGCVSQLFRCAAQSPYLWTSVRLGNLLVTNWRMASKHLKRVRSEKLDIRGVHLDENDPAWTEFINSLHRLTALKSLELGRCQVAVVHAAAEKLVRLEALTAEVVDSEQNCDPSLETNDSRLDLTRFSGVENLRHFKIRSKSGMNLNVTEPVLWDLQRVDIFKNLQTLSLTTVRECDTRLLTFIGRLTSLRVLEIGQCSSWDSRMFTEIGKLVNLVALRLEYGSRRNEGLPRALTKLTRLKHLDLTKFTLDPILGLTLGSLSQLTKFSFWPDLPSCHSQMADMNRRNLAYLGQMSFLARLDWGYLSTDDHLIPFKTHPSLRFELAHLSETRIDLDLKQLDTNLRSYLPHTIFCLFKVPYAAPAISPPSHSTLVVEPEAGSSRGPDCIVLDE